MSQRVEELVRCGADRDLINVVAARWHGLVGPVTDFDFSEVTAVEVSSDVFAHLNPEESES